MTDEVLVADECVRNLMLRVVVAVVVLTCVFESVSNGWAAMRLGSIGRMKLVSPGAGWVRGDDQKLYWTDTGGAKWEEITPPLAREGQTERLRLGEIFFLDTRTGWALLIGGDRAGFPPELGERLVAQR